MTSARVTAGASREARVSAILFDLDGVLVDSLLVVERSWRRWAREQDLSGDDVLAVVHGRTAREVIGLLTPHLDAAEQALLVGGYEREHRGDLALLPGARECVGIARQGRWAVVTSGTRALATTRLAAVGLPVPEVLVTADDVTFGKPDPEPYRRGAELIHSAPADCLVVEDAPSGVGAGIAAGCSVLGVLGTHTEKELRAAGASWIVRSLEDVSAQTSPNGVTLHLRAI